MILTKAQVVEGLRTGQIAICIRDDVKFSGDLNAFLKQTAAAIADDIESESVPFPEMIAEADCEFIVTGLFNETVH